MKEELFVFVLMPFSKSFDDIYKVGIKAACKELNVYCERVDEQIFSGNILERMYNQIRKADIIISDMSGKNVNVFYETGYAHALDKRVILLTQNADDIPFDLMHYSHIVYGGSISDLKDELTKRLDWFIKNPEQKKLPNVLSFEYYFQGEKIEEGKKILLQNYLLYDFYDNNSGYNFTPTCFDFQLNIYNPNNKLVELKSKFAIETSWLYFANASASVVTIKMPEDKFLHIHSALNTTVYPLLYETVTFRFLSHSRYSGVQDFILKIYNEVEVKEIHFKLDFS
jgi:hypothetical protein